MSPSEPPRSPFRGTHPRSRVKRAHRATARLRNNLRLQLDVAACGSALGFLLGVFGLALLATADHPTPFMHRLFDVIAVGGFFLGFSLAALAHGKAEEVRAPSIQELSERLVKGPPRPYVLYLRTFDQFETFGLFPLEQALRLAVAPAADLVLIEEPGMDTGRLGAEWMGARLPGGPGELWRARVDRLLDGAAVVIVRLAASEGLLWEFARVRERVDPGRLAVLPRRGGRWEELAPVFQSIIGTSWPASRPYLARVLTFDPQWNPRFTEGRVSLFTRALFSARHEEVVLRCEMLPVLERAGLAVHPPWTNGVWASGCFVVVFWLFVALAAVAFGVLGYAIVHSPYR